MRREERDWREALLYGERDDVEPALDLARHREHLGDVEHQVRIETGEVERLDTRESLCPCAAHDLQQRVGLHHVRHIRGHGEHPVHVALGFVERTQNRLRMTGMTK